MYGHNRSIYRVLSIPSEKGMQILSQVMDDKAIKNSPEPTLYNTRWIKALAYFGHAATAVVLGISYALSDIPLPTSSAYNIPLPPLKIDLLYIYIYSSSLGSPLQPSNNIIIAYNDLWGSKVTTHNNYLRLEDSLGMRLLFTHNPWYKNFNTHLM